jgi:hypothetical protein
MKVMIWEQKMKQTVERKIYFVAKFIIPDWGIYIFDTGAGILGQSMGTRNRVGI